MNFTSNSKAENGKLRHHCPSCRHIIPSKRHIVEDKNFDSLIKSLKCSRDDTEADNQVDISAYQQNHMARVQEMKKYQAQNKEKILSQPYKTPASLITSTAGTRKRGRKLTGNAKVGRPRMQVEEEPEHEAVSDDITTTYSGYVNFSLKYYNFENPNDQILNMRYNLSRPFVRADCSSTIMDLKLLLCSYFTSFTTESIDMYAWSTQHDTMIHIENDMTLIEFCTTIWNQQSSLVFFYSFQGMDST